MRQAMRLRSSMAYYKVFREVLCSETSEALSRTPTTDASGEPLTRRIHPRAVVYTRKWSNSSTARTVYLRPSWKARHRRTEERRPGLLW
jgi:hypothetical protein